VPQTRTPPVLWTGHGFEVAIGTKGRGTRIETPGFAAQKEIDRQLDEAERVRLLYVAATRARDHLVVSLHHKAADTRSYAARLWSHAGDAPAEPLAPSLPPLASTHERGGAEPPGDDRVRRQEWVAERETLLAHAARPATVAATGLARAGGDRELDRGAAVEAGDGAGDRPPWRRGRAGTAIGRAVHAVLQTVDLATGSDVAATARAQALAEGIPEREAEVRALVESVRLSPAVRAAVAGERYWREVPVAANVDGLVLEGFVDLLTESHDGLVVVDYKTDRAHDDADLDSLVGGYRIQGASYALAVERAVGRSVRRCVFVFARAGGTAVERAVDDLPGAVREVEARVRALGTGPAASLP
jgi:ATP-dependent helicase/nuclease subunit A